MCIIKSKRQNVKRTNCNHKTKNNNEQPKEIRHQILYRTQLSTAQHNSIELNWSALVGCIDRCALIYLKVQSNEWYDKKVIWRNFISCFVKWNSKNATVIFFSHFQSFWNWTIADIRCCMESIFCRHFFFWNVFFPFIWHGKGDWRRNTFPHHF